MCVLGVQRTATVRALVKRGEPVQAVNSRDERLVSFGGDGLGHSSIVDAPPLWRSDAEIQSRSGSQ
jgi:uncharacterized protein YbjT (DUF2867 family)